MCVWAVKYINTNRLTTFGASTTLRPTAFFRPWGAVRTAPRRTTASAALRGRVGSGSRSRSGAPSSVSRSGAPRECGTDPVGGGSWRPILHLV